ncbi:MAG TPA: gephyrin-like molybdotransferase Glp [Methylococcaceae bacterium]|nr:gephyrin-like molybdotransferase Glp [Methylococcaceae bacterium]
MLPLEAALARLLAEIAPLPHRERLPLRAGLHRILAEDFRAPRPLPNWRNAAMDGYALRSAEVAPDGETCLKVKGTSWAGRPFDGVLEAGECVRVFTGAVLPDGADAVVMQERVRQAGDAILVSTPVVPNEFVREAGEDIPAEAVALTAGKRLTPSDLGLLAALGACEISVRQRPRVAFFSTGDELRPAGAPLQPGEIYDSNRTLLHGLLAECGVEALDLGRVPDRLETTRTVLSEAAEMADVVIATGGASVGEADLIRGALQEQGALRFWRVAIKPGKPFIHGRIGEAQFFGLPGNPVSVWITFRQLVRPALDKLAGAQPAAPLRIPVLSREGLRKEPGRLEFRRGRLEQDAGGTLWVHALSGQGAHQLKSLSDADCLIVLPADCRSVAAGEAVWVEPLSRG